MRTLRLCLPALAALFVHSAVQAAEEPLVQEATGQAAILNGDKPAARDKALADAQRNAVQMVAGTLVTATTEVQDFQTKMDQVLTHTTGFISSYDVLKEGAQEDLYSITIRAKVKQGELNGDMAAKGLLLQRKGMPRLMLLIGEQNIAKVAPGATDATGASTVVSTDLRIGENVMIDEFKNSGFGQILDGESATQQGVSVGKITSSLTDSQVRTLKKAKVEVVIVGQVQAISRGPSDISPDWKMCVANMSVRAINTDNSDVLATAETTQSFSHLDEVTCGKETIKRATKAATDVLAAKIFKRWHKDVSGGNEVHVTVRNVDSRKQSRELQSALKEFVRGVKAVSERGFEDGVLDLDITLVGSTGDFADEVEAKNLGKFSVKVKGNTANTVTLELGKK
jgi:hypothetical protein